MSEKVLSECSFDYTGPNSFSVTNEIHEAFDKFGFVIVRKLFSNQENDKMVKKMPSHSVEL
jgi:hypothetical protein